MERGRRCWCARVIYALTGGSPGSPPSQVRARVVNDGVSRLSGSSTLLKFPAALGTALQQQTRVSAVVRGRRAAVRPPGHEGVSPMPLPKKLSGCYILRHNTAARAIHDVVRTSARGGAAVFVNQPLLRPATPARGSSISQRTAPLRMTLAPAAIVGRPLMFPLL